MAVKLSTIGNGSRIRINHAVLMMLTIILAGASVAAMERTEVIVNGDFEMSPCTTHWTANPGAICASAAALNGVNGIGLATYSSISQTFSPVSTDSIRSLSFWIKGQPGSSGYSLGVYLQYQGSHEYLSLGLEPYWREIDLTGRMEPGQWIEGISIQTSSASAYLDNVSLLSVRSSLQERILNGRFGLDPCSSYWTLLGSAACLSGFMYLPPSSSLYQSFTPISSEAIETLSFWGRGQTSTQWFYVQIEYDSGSA